MSAPAPSDRPAANDPGCSPGRYWLILSVLVLMGCALAAGFAMRTLKEQPGTNSYALLAQSWLEGRLDSPDCFDGDCARFDARTYVIFPPAPAAVIAPFVAASGEGAQFRHFMPVALALLLAIAFIWTRLFALAGAGGDQTKTLILLLALVFATPLYYVTLRADRVWFFAQLVGFFFVSAALWAAILRRNGWLAGLFIGLAFLSRQMTLLYVPFLYALMIPDGQPLLRISRARMALALKLGLPVLAAVTAYCAYNYVRFGDPLETGYAFIAAATSPQDANVITERIRDIGLFSSDYLVFNTIYMFVQGLHIEFGGPYLTHITGVDPFGTSILAASPFLLLLVLVERHRLAVIGLGTAAVICTVTLFYHSNGFSQYNTQRYALDWLPIAMLLLAPTVRANRRAILAVLVGYAMMLNLATMAALKLSGAV